MPTATLSVTLPPELTFDSASIPPTTTSPLTWDLGSLPTQATAEPFVITATVDAGTNPLQTISTQFEIDGTPIEIETENNISIVTVFIGEQLYLPLISKQ